MSKQKYLDEVSSLTDEIERYGDVWELYYKRGFFYFLLNETDNAKEDYNHALALGLDPTVTPYYSFSNSNEMRRDFVLPEKILVFLILIVVSIALVFQVASFVLKVKGSL